jgi:hypothetical protein
MIAVSCRLGLESLQLLDTPWMGEKPGEHDARQEAAHVRPVRHATTGRRVATDARHAAVQLQQEPEDDVRPGVDSRRPSFEPVRCPRVIPVNFAAGFCRLTNS